MLSGKYSKAREMSIYSATPREREKEREALANWLDRQQSTDSRIHTQNQFTNSVTEKGKRNERKNVRPSLSLEYSCSLFLFLLSCHRTLSHPDIECAHSSYIFFILFFIIHKLDIINNVPKYL